MTRANEFALWQQRVQAQTELLLERLMPSETEQSGFSDGLSAPHAAPQRLHEAMRYAALGGGKRLRPLLVSAAANLGEADKTALAQAMAAVELIHVYSLVHDDMPAMDNDSLRRGKPTCHIRYDEATALLVGDALQTLAFELLSRTENSNLPAERRLKMLNLLARASGSLGMAGGQAIDLANVGQNMTQPALEAMHGLKTGALIRAAVGLGGLVCPDINETALQRLDDYAKHLGLAFQVIDDVLDCEADTATLGKTAGKDQEADKPTYVKLLGLAQARAYAETLAAQAVAALDGFDSRADYLRDLAA
ncbi:MAG: polyprenyl synthetase family protein, partial [Neisseria sp.]|nr:polyprenyl synthetase family protein [Neisseria sp.]